ncbi:MAG TPA: RsmB/NOP family class I SAM-dependent RNA methyltransferase [Bacteroidia bacterium]|nr:RsmB/NOP family class I SAM-dependent RNA methyltransferase [Bacteroidia bacterium]
MKRKPKGGQAQVGSLFLLKETFDNFLEHGIMADRALQDTFRKYKLRDERIRAELARRFYGIIRSWRPLTSALGMDEFNTVKEIGLLVGTWNNWRKIYHGEKPAETSAVTDRLEKYMRVRKLRESFPDWLDARCESELGAEWETIAHALNTEAPIFLRTNQLKITREMLLKKLREEGFSIQPAENEEGILVEGYQHVFASPSFKDGLFEVQDLSSQKVAPFLNVEPGMRVADACAGSGGKTIHLAALMQNRGKIVAMDVSAKKLEELRKRCIRSGADLVEIRPVDSAKRMEETFDRVLLDVPCSGTGVLRRNPDIRWRLTPENLESMIAEQQQILQTYSSLVKTGGRLVYATCSILPSEGEDQIQKFLSGGKSWELEQETRIDPSKSPGDGFYFARLKKNA